MLCNVQRAHAQAKQSWTEGLIQAATVYGVAITMAIKLVGGAPIIVVEI